MVKKRTAASAMSPPPEEKPSKRGRPPTKKKTPAEVEKDLKTIVEEVVKSRLHVITSELEELREDYKDLYQELEHLKQYGRRNAIRIYNPEWVELPGENTDDTVLKFFSETLSVDLDKSHIDRSHHVGPKDRSRFGGPRPILVKFTSYRARERVVKSRSALLGTDIQINEDLTKFTSSLAFEARKAKRNNDLIHTSVYDGKVFVKAPSADTSKVVESEEELSHYIAHQVVYTSATRPSMAPPGWRHDGGARPKIRQTGNATGPRGSGRRTTRWNTHLNPEARPFVSKPPPRSAPSSVSSSPKRPTSTTQQQSMAADAQQQSLATDAQQQPLATDAEQPTQIADSQQQNLTSMDTNNLPPPPYSSPPRRTPDNSRVPDNKGTSDGPEDENNIDALSEITDDSPSLLD